MTNITWVKISHMDVYHGSYPGLYVGRITEDLTLRLYQKTDDERGFRHIYTIEKIRRVRTKKNEWIVGTFCSGCEFDPCPIIVSLRIFRPLIRSEVVEEIENIFNRLIARIKANQGTIARKTIAATQ